MGFFDQRPKLRGSIAPNYNRLECRYRAMLAWNRKWIDGCTILDIGAYNGRWSYASLFLGAKHVTAVEINPASVNKAQSNMQDFDESKYTLVCGDIHKEIVKFEVGQFDTILCFGFFYHTAKHEFLADKMTLLQPKAIIIDTQLAKPGTGIQYNRKPYYGRQGKPSYGVVQKMFGSRGYTIVKRSNYNQFKNQEKISDYVAGKDGGRVTVLLRPKKDVAQETAVAAAKKSKNK